MASKNVVCAPQCFQIEDEKNVSAEFHLWLEYLETYFELHEVNSHSKKRNLLLNLGGLEYLARCKGFGHFTG